MEKKNKIRFALLVVLLLATSGLIFFTQNQSTDLVDPALFKIEGLDKIDRIVLASKAETINLTFSGGRWKVNDQFNADKQLIDVLFATIDQTKPKREIGKLNADSVSQWLSRSGVLVSWYEGDVLKKQFVAGGNNRKTEAYFQQQGQNYLMTIPGYRVYVSGIFEVGAGMWRDKRVFDFNWRNFRGLAVKFPMLPKENYEILIKNAQFHIEGISKVDTTKVNEYIDGAFQLNAKEILSASKRSAYDSLLKTAPAFVVEVQDIANRTYLLEIFPPKVGATDVVGRMGQGEVAVFERNAVTPLAKKKSYFAQK